MYDCMYVYVCSDTSSTCSSCTMHICACAHIISQFDKKKIANVDRTLKLKGALKRKSLKRLKGAHARKRIAYNILIAA